MLFLRCFSKLELFIIIFVIWRMIDLIGMIHEKNGDVPFGLSVIVQFD
jgi:hypothetical protein